MPKVYQRKLSFGEVEENKRRISTAIKRGQLQGTMTTDEFEESRSKRHGPIRIRRPHSEFNN